MAGDSKVVVIGGGYGGTEVAKGLDKDFAVTLVTGQETMVHAMAGARGSVQPGWEIRCLVPYTSLLKRGKIFTSRVSRIDPDASKVTLTTGEVLDYDYLVLATGILGPKTVGYCGTATTKEQQLAAFTKRQSEIAEASNILIVGGGPVGIELAGEIMETHPSKKVTLVTSKALMVYPIALFEKLRTNLKTKMEAAGVTVHLNAGHVTISGEDVEETGFIKGRRSYEWNGGSMEADLCIVATGSTQTPSLYADSGLGSWLDEKGQIKVDSKTLEVKEAGGGGKIFAVGDCVNLPIPKLGYLAGEAAKGLCKNVRASAAGKPLKDVAPPVMAIQLVPFGSKGGVGQLPFTMLGNWSMKMMKSKGLFCGKTWAALNAGKPPAVMTSMVAASK